MSFVGWIWHMTKTMKEVNWRKPLLQDHLLLLWRVLKKCFWKNAFAFVAGYDDLAVAVARPPVSSRPPIISINLCWSVLLMNVEFFLVVVLIVVVWSFGFDLLRIIQEIGLITLSLFWYIYIIMINAAVYDLMFRFFRVLHTLVLSQSPSSSKGKTCQHKLIGKTCYIDLHLPFVPKNISIFEISLILVLFPSFVITEQPDLGIKYHLIMSSFSSRNGDKKENQEAKGPDQTPINE